MPPHLVDTNILTSIVDQTTPRHAVAVNALRTLQAEGHALAITSQNLMEFWRVATRPVLNNGMGLTPSVADSELQRLELLFPRLADRDDVYDYWRTLVTTLSISGTQVHDARLVAVMISYRITHILTFNVKDFARYAGPAGITVVDPATK